MIVIIVNNNVFNNVLKNLQKNYAKKMKRIIMKINVYMLAKYYI